MRDHSTLIYSQQYYHPIDADLSMWTHVQQTVTGCCAVLRQIRSVRQPLPLTALQILVVSLTLNRLNYGNATLPAYKLRYMQSILNAMARTILGLPCSVHISSSLARVHRLRAAEHIKFKLATLTYRCLHSIAPRYLLFAELLRVADVLSRRRLHSAATDALLVRPI